MTNQINEAKKTEIEMFNSNRFQEMFELATNRQFLIQENTILLNNFFSLLNLESLKVLAQKDKIGEFLDALVNFLKNELPFNKNEKKRLLNGCENVLFLHALMLGKNDCANFLNQFRLDKSLQLNRNFLTNRIAEQKYDVVDNLLDLSENVTYDSSKVLKALYVSLCRDYEFIKKIIAKHNFDINAYGDLGLDENFKGTFLHVVALMADPESNKFFSDFIKDYGSKINFDINFMDTERESEINVLDLIINNDKIDPIEKMARITTILTYGSLGEKHLKYLCNILVTEQIVSRYYNDGIYDALFANHNFNSATFDRETVLNKILSLDNSELFKKVRSESNNTINPTSVILDKFFRFSSHTHSNNSHPFSLWIQLNSTNDAFSLDTLISLIKHYKNELHEIGIVNLKMPIKMADILRQIGLPIPEKKGIIPKIFKREQEYKERTTTTSEVKKVQPVAYLPNNSNTATKPTTTTTQSTGFNLSLYLNLTDKDIKSYVGAIVLQTNQYLTVAKEGNQEYLFMKTKVPKLLNATIENYFRSLGINPIEAKKNTLFQLKMLQKKSFDLTSAELVK